MTVRPILVSQKSSVVLEMLRSLRNRRSHDGILHSLHSSDNLNRIFKSLGKIQRAAKSELVDVIGKLGHGEVLVPQSLLEAFQSRRPVSSGE